MSSSLLSASLVERVLAHLGVQPVLLSLSFLDELVTAYTRSVPWETAFRIVRRADVVDTAVCPRWPEQFWQEAVTLGSGGTCFESNYAFFALLQALGFDSYLTINNMGEKIGCHSAIVIQLGAEKWLADVGLPLYAPLPVSPDGKTRRVTTFQHYTVRPDGRNRYQIERFPHPGRNAFTLIDQPVPEDVYRARVAADY
ncbi:MAG TPA: arylamine N-acetyltransferase, partial [Anaerolineae bacterium]|nr:arylamine N-acetyltransferase [Anaerolineae bacterium]